MKKFRIKLLREATFTVTSPFEIKIEAKDEEAAQKRAEELSKDFMNGRYTEELLEVSPSPWNTEVVLTGCIGHQASIEFDDFKNIYLASIEEIEPMKGA